MSKPKKKEYWLKRTAWGYAMSLPIEPGRYGSDFQMSCSPLEWHKTFAVPRSQLRLREDHKIKISITPTKTGFRLDAIGKPEKI